MTFLSVRLANRYFLVEVIMLLWTLFVAKLLKRSVHWRPSDISFHALHLRYQFPCFTFGIGILIYYELLKGSISYWHFCGYKIITYISIFLAHLFPHLFLQRNLSSITCYFTINLIGERADRNRSALWFRAEFQCSRGLFR